MRKTELADNVYHILVNVGHDDLFEGLWPIPHGVSLNSYLVRGEKTALIDLVRDWNGAPSKLMGQLKKIGLKPDDIDYLVLNHLEPDHTGWLAEFHKLNPNIEIISTQKGLDLVNDLYRIENPIRAVKTGDQLDLGGGKTLSFYEIPNVHWPETMATFQNETGILFSCDAFGSFGSVGDASFDDELSEEQHAFFEEETLRYYANIVASFSSFVLRAVDKLADLDIKMIAPSHGIVWRKDPKKIIDRYVHYANYFKGPAEEEICLIWGTMYGNTGKLIEAVAQTVKDSGLKLNQHQVPQSHLSYILASAWKSTGLILAMPTYEYKMFPPMANVLDMFSRKHVQNRKVFRFGSFGWSGGAQRELDGMIKSLKWDCLEPYEFRGNPDENDRKQIQERTAQLITEVREAVKASA